MFANEYGGEGRFPLPLKGRTLDIKAGSLSLEDFFLLVRLFILHPIFLLGSLYWYTKKKREKKDDSSIALYIRAKCFKKQQRRNGRHKYFTVYNYNARILKLVSLFCAPEKGLFPTLHDKPGCLLGHAAHHSERRTLLLLLLLLDPPKPFIHVGLLPSLDPSAQSSFLLLLLLRAKSHIARSSSPLFSRFTAKRGGGKGDRPRGGGGGERREAV